VIVKYRIMQSRWEKDDSWETWGIIYENHGKILRDYPILYSMMLSDPKEIKRHFDQNIRERQLSIKNAEEALGDYAGRYRLLPEIHAAEGDSFNDIVADLEERYLGYKRPKSIRRELAVLAESGQEYRLD
jgi:hypothetical protein